MKSLPEKNFWNNIKTRLSNYTEEPEDDWDDIAAIISPSRYDARKWIEFSQDIASAVALILLLMFTVTTTDTVPARTETVTTDRNISSDQKTSKEKSILDAHQKEKHKPATDADESIEESDALINRSGTSSNTNVHYRMAINPLKIKMPLPQPALNRSTETIYTHKAATQAKQMKPTHRTRI
jgi:hypothetical protein